MNKKRRVVLVVLVFGILLCACSDKNLEISEKRKAESSDENKEAYEKGYHLPIKKEEREKAEKDSIAALKLVQHIYAEADYRFCYGADEKDTRQRGSSGN